MSQEEGPSIDERNAVIDAFLLAENINRTDIEESIAERAYRAIRDQHRPINAITRWVDTLLLPSVFVCSGAIYLLCGRDAKLTFTAWNIALILVLSVRDIVIHTFKAQFFSGRSLPALYFLGWRSIVAAVFQPDYVRLHTVDDFVWSHMQTVLYMQLSNTEAFQDIDQYDSVKSGKETRVQVIELILCKRILDCWNLHYMDSFKYRLLGRLSLIREVGSNNNTSQLTIHRLQYQTEHRVC